MPPSLLQRQEEAEEAVHRNILQILTHREEPSHHVQDDPPNAAEIRVRYSKDYFCVHFMLIRFIFCSMHGAAFRHQI